MPRKKTKKTKAKSPVRRRARLDRAAQQQREVAIISDLKAGALSYRKIAQKHGVSLPTVNAKARKAGITRPRGRRPGSTTRTATRTVPTRAVTVAHSGAFQEAFREMVLHYYPTISLAKFDRLAKLVDQAIR
ncbi:MAG: hypothetical protein GF346_01895 [Candidatus Eisenbacteria bacterium]|nr:hypothetical protein [Candidatus Latescibacterota bacterium]MBD3301183.1 hypothetical protein [Candidatus Eisenbacteria bacterium]